MVKAKDFIVTLCEGFDYRVFSGIPSLSLKVLYDKLNGKYLHYIPAVRLNTALGIINGTYITGLKGCVLLDISKIYDIFTWLLNFNCSYNIPILIIVGYNKENTLDPFLKVLDNYSLPYVNLSKDFKKDLEYIDNYTTTNLLPGFVFIKEGVLS